MEWRLLTYELQYRGQTRRLRPYLDVLIVLRIDWQELNSVWLVQNYLCLPKKAGLELEALTAHISGLDHGLRSHYSIHRWYGNPIVSEFYPGLWTDPSDPPYQSRRFEDSADLLMVLVQEMPGSQIYSWKKKTTII